MFTVTSGMRLVFGIAEADCWDMSAYKSEHHLWSSQGFFWMESFGLCTSQLSDE